jgi:ParB-like chromosome segregation protein Spo0J
MQIEYRRAVDLTPYENNSRTHSKEQVGQIVESIKEFGFTNPILIDEAGGIIAGHGRLEAANALGMEEVPTITLTGLSEAQKRAYVIADNSLAMNAGWDIDTLKGEVERLAELDFDTTLLGLSDEVLRLVDPEDVPLGLTPEEKLENFLNGDTKILRLAYSQEELEVIVEKLDAGLAHTGAEDYSTLVFDLVLKEASKW